MNRSLSMLRRVVLVVAVVLTAGVTLVESPVSALVGRRAGDTCLNEGRVVVTSSGNLRCERTASGLRWRPTTASVPESLTPKSVGEECIIIGRVVTTGDEILQCVRTARGLQWRAASKGGAPSSPAPFGGAAGTLKSGDSCLNEGRVVVGASGNLRCTKTASGLVWRPTTASVPESLTPKVAGDECIIIGRVVTTGSEVLQCVRTDKGSEWRGVRLRGDASGPSVTSFVSASSVSSSASVVYTITFSEPVTGVEPADFSNSGTATGCSFAVSGSGATRTVTVSGCSEGSIVPTFGANGARDLSGNSGPSSSSPSSSPVTRDATAPTVSVSQSASGTLKASQSSIVSFTVSETVTGFSAASVNVTGGSLTGFTGSGTSYSATFVPTPGSFGIASLQVSAGAFTDPAGNPNAASNTVGIPYDTAIPSVVSFTSAASTPTNSATISYTLTFSESVTGVLAGDFSNSGTATGCSFAPGSDSGTTRTVLVSGCSEGTIIPRFVANGGTDTAGNTGPSSNSTATSTVTRDTTSPTVTGFTTTQSTPTNASSIEYTLTFSEDVTGLTAEDFSNSGTATGCTFGVSGSGTTYTVTVSSCTAGTIIPSFDSGGATDDAGNSGPTLDAESSTTVTRDTTAPSVIGFTSGDSATSDASVEFTITFSESVTGLTPGDFSNTGTATGCTFAVSGSGTTYTVTVSGCSEGTIIPSFDSGSATDTAGNTGPTSDADATTTVTRDTTAPTVTGFTSSASTPTNSATISFTLTFSESVTGVLAGDFSNAGSASGCSFAPGSDSGTTRTVLVSGCSSGTITPVFAANGATDAAGNTGPASGATATTTITRDSTAPTVTGFTSAQSTPTNASSIEYEITFSKSVSDITSGDFSNSGTATGCSFAVSGSGTTYTVTVSGCSAGTIIPQFTVNGATDTAGNTGPASPATATTTITRDTTAPTVTGFTSSQSTPTNASSIEYELTFSESVAGIASGDFSNTGTATGCSFAVSGSGSSYTVTVSGCSAGTIIPQFAANGGTDTAGNTGPASAATATTTITRDTTAPTVTGFTSSESSPTSNTSIEYTLTFSESVTGIASGDFTNSGTATGCSFAVSGSGSSYTVTVSGCTADGTIIPQFASGGATDTAGNGGPASASTSTTTLNFILQFTVTFNSNGGTGSMTSQTSASATNLTANSFTRTGYTFAGWNTLANGSGTPYADSASYPFSSSTTLYAQWTANTYTISYDGNGNTGGSAPSSGSATFGSSFTPAAAGSLVRSGYTFIGWDTESDGTGTAFAAGTPVTWSVAANTTLYAQWAGAGSLDTTFSVGTGAASRIFALLPLSDGDVLVGGEFATWSGTAVGRFVRLNSDGSIDTTFMSSVGSAANSGTVKALAVQSDGKIIVAGYFTQWSGTAVGRIVRLNVDGTLDTTFQTNVGTAANNGLDAVALQSDGSIIVGGSFTEWNGNTSAKKIVRLNTDGTRDSTFSSNIGDGPDGGVQRVGVLSDDRIAVLVPYSYWDGEFGVRDVALLSADGELDATFWTNVGFGAKTASWSMVITASDKILIGFTGDEWNNNSTYRNIVRLGTDGNVDTSFALGFAKGPEGSVYALALQSDGGVIAAGAFTYYRDPGYVTVNRVVRQQSTGPRDADFNTDTGTAANDDIWVAAVAADGKIYLAGAFTTWNGQTVGRIVRLVG